MNYKSLFTPFKIGTMEVKNRIVMSPMGTNSARIDGTIAEDEIAYFEERAKGGTGMIIMGCQFLNPDLAQGSLEGVLQNTYVIPQLTTVVEACHRWGAKICCQISCGTGRNAFPNMYGEAPFSSSDTPSTYNPNMKCRPLSKEQIKDIMKQFKNSAKIAKDAGYDSIEVHAHAGYLVDQFMSSIWNTRTDEYGGSLENRMRFACEIVESIKSAVGKDIPVIFRIALDHLFEGGRTLEESMEIIKILEAAGVDALDIDAGCYERIDYIFPTAYLGDACMEYVCEEARKHVNIPIMNSGNHTPETAVRLIESGNADFVMFGRQLIADPETANKLMNEHAEDVRPCIRCNEECVGRIITRLSKISCAVNVQVCEEARFKIEEAKSKKNVVVVGGGPAGLEAARVAALEGHKVILFEKEGVVGGQLSAAATPKFKDQLKKLVKWYQVQLEKLGVDVRLNTAVDMNNPALEEADNIIVATGAKPIEVNIKGIDGSNVLNVIDAHKHKERIKGDHVVICGGGLSGCDSALELALEEGKKVTIVEMAEGIAKDVMYINLTSILVKIKEAGINVFTSSKVSEINEQGVVIEKADGTKENIAADTVITAFGMKKDSDLADKIREKYYNKTRIVGDSEKVGKVATAVRSGFYAGLSL
ncbi:NAD(P)/FAD-dependent oxidoreductase [Anaeromicropila herbilytica]|uniref:2-enoate reductase n=1 Tax=Anaeromicropila herbilytica TaxID=2785025 RepID=A0A7R7ICF0_9FIRM|nr:NAD(P)/FAD-dependent oxidoreductase [Anaeromicropila herbilytica]BCN29796.1 2-enoate reductase [Anaeromicropila herbilytica]